MSCMLNSNKVQVYKVSVNQQYTDNVLDNTFILYPEIRRVDFHIVFTNKIAIPDWAKIASIPEQCLGTEENIGTWNGLAVYPNGTNCSVGVCYISPSNNGYIAPCGISSAKVGSTINLFGNYWF